MSDDLVKQALAELGDVVRCRCHEAYTGRGMHDPDCQCDSADAVKAVSEEIAALQARVAELEAERDEADDLANAAFADGASNNIRLAEAAHRIELLETRTKEAVETLRKGFKSGDPTKTAAAIILAIAQLEGHGE